jgi:hypothetical protein
MYHQHDADLNPIYINLKSNKYTTQISTSHYLFELNKTITSRPNVDMIMTIDSFKFTNSFYIINSTNDKFYYRLESDSYITLYTVSVPHGNYSSDSLITYLNSNTPFTFSFNEINFKITVTHSSLEFVFVVNDNNINNVLGFVNNLGSTSYTITGDKLINLIGSQMLYIQTTNLNINTVLNKNDNTNTNIILSTPIIAHSGDVQVVNNSANHSHKINQNSINNIEIKIVDEHDNEIDFNGIDWFLNLSVIFSYKKIKLLPQYLLDDDNNDNNEDNKKERQKNNIK